MSFDKKWENQIYKYKKQTNKYPFDKLVSEVNRLFRNKKINKFKVLDLGCGTGNNSKFLIEFGFNYITAIDGSKSAIEIAKKFVKSKKCKFYCCDFDNFKFIDNKFDLIIDRGSLTHNKKNFINDIYRKVFNSLKAEGYLISYVFNKKHSEFKNQKKNNTFKSSMNVNSQMIASFFDKSEIKKIFKRFKLVSLSETIDTDIINKYSSAYWHIIAQKK
jgi:SAM-dependent methyltransferase